MISIPFLNDILLEFFFFQKWKKMGKFCLKLSQTYGSAINFAYFEALFLNMLIEKKFPSELDTNHLRGRGRILSPHT